MSRSADPGHFFQTDASEATRARRVAKSGNKNGNPIKLQSKILGIIADPLSENYFYLAESAGCVRCVNIKDRDSKTVYRGPAAPLTSVAVSSVSSNTIFAGCWDKDIWSWERKTQVLNRRYKGHSDFVKAIITVQLSGKDLLISGGADSKIMIWDTATGTRLHTLRDRTDTMRAVQCLAVDPIASTPDELILFSSHSDPTIRRWRISLSTASQILQDDFSTPVADVSNTLQSTSLSTNSAILEHETSVYALLFDSDEEGDLWTASADGTAKCLARAKDWAAEETLVHGDYVRAIGVTADWIITAGRDEDVKVWDRNTGNLYHVYEGHYEEVTGLLVVNDGRAVITVSVDGTVRLWPLEKAKLEQAKIDREERAKGVVKEDAKPTIKKSLLTAEEEAELAELMDSD